MTVITMTREMGTLGKDVAAGVAEALGLEVIHHEVIERDVADRMNLGESDVHRFLEGKPSLLDRWKIDKGKLSHYTAEEIYDIAAQGNAVIRGWGATGLLRAVPHILRVRVCAPMTFRVRVLQERLELKDAKIAQREIERNDATHTRALQSLLTANWEAPLNYDLVLNTERLPITDCVNQVVSLAKSTAFEKTTRSQQILTDLMIESQIRNQIENHIDLVAAARHVDISVTGGDVVVTGAVESTELGQRLCQQLQSISGVQMVTNNLIAVPAYRG